MGRYVPAYKYIPVANALSAFVRNALFLVCGSLQYGCTELRVGFALPPISWCRWWIFAGEIEGMAVAAVHTFITKV